MQKEIVSAYPNITVIDTEKTIQAFLGILEKVTQMIRLMTGLILMSALILVFTSLYSSHFERKKEFSLMRVIGGSSRFLSMHFLREGLLISTIAFMIGFVYSLIGNEILNRYILELRPVIPWGNLVLVFIGVIIITLVIYQIGILNLFRLPSKQLLKEIK